MKARKLLVPILFTVVALALAGTAGLVLARAGEARLSAGPLGTPFTYQGRLMDGDSPADGLYDLEFTLHDDLTGGAQIAGPITKQDVDVTDGLFTVSLDFGSGAFTGDARWLEIGVRPAGSVDPCTPLSPRQELTAAPYALYANSAPWDGLSGVPLDIADGDDDTTYANGTGLLLTDHTFSADTSYLQRRVSGTCAAGSSIRAINPTGAVTCESDDGITYVRTVLVSPVGTQTENGTALLVALAGISGASDTNRWLLKIEPGVYNLGSSALQMKQYVDIEGSGELATKIKSVGSASLTTGTVLGASNAELRFLTVENTGGSPPIQYATAIYMNGASPRLTHVTARVDYANNNYAVQCLNGAEPKMNDVTIIADGLAGTDQIGVRVVGGSPELTNSTIQAWNGYSYGIWVEHGGAQVTNTTVETPVDLMAVTRYGIYNLSNPSGGGVIVDRSTVRGSTNTIMNMQAAMPWVNKVTVGASLLDGGAAINCGFNCTLKCAGVYDENYTFSTGPVCP